MCYRARTTEFSLRGTIPPIFSLQYQADLLIYRGTVAPSSTRGYRAVTCFGDRVPAVLPHGAMVLVRRGFYPTPPKRSQRPEGIQGWAHPFSLAATRGISVDFFYAAYLYA